MDNGLDRLIRWAERLAIWAAMAGALVILLQMLWISYGVFARYGLGNPDRFVTEATALLLFPVAFAGLAFALRENAMPQVTLLTQRLSAEAQRGLAIVNHLVMLVVGAFFAYAGASATIGSFQSGVASEILGWPRWMFWAPGAASLLLFAIYVLLRLVWLTRHPNLNGTVNTGDK
jgi:TRAP-type C4-dicarboxylate transport system permease small subunit